MPDNGIDWVDSYKESIKRSKEENKPVMIDFSAEWCPPCKVMKSKVFTDGKVVEGSRNFVCLMIDINNNNELASRYNITAVPTLVFLDSAEVELFRMTGLIEPKHVVELMQDALNAQSSLACARESTTSS